MKKTERQLKFSLWPGSEPMSNGIHCADALYNNASHDTNNPLIHCIFHQQECIHPLPLIVLDLIMLALITNDVRIKQWKIYKTRYDVRRRRSLYVIYSIYSVIRIIKSSDMIGQLTIISHLYKQIGQLIESDATCSTEKTFL